jgi:signal transduction histidine kinase
VEGADALAAAVEETAAELKVAIVDLRELARGIHPAILTDGGLGPAIESLAIRSPVPVRIEELPKGRLPEAAEATSYFVVAECLTNVARYAEARTAVIRSVLREGALEIEVRDDGVGGADPSAGSGLRGLEDRVAAVGGRLEIASPLGGGTTIRAVIPIDG